MNIQTVYAATAMPAFKSALGIRSGHLFHTLLMPNPMVRRVINPVTPTSTKAKAWASDRDAKAALAAPLATTKHSPGMRADLVVHHRRAGDLSLDLAGRPAWILAAMIIPRKPSTDGTSVLTHCATDMEAIMAATRSAREITNYIVHIIVILHKRGLRALGRVECRAEGEGAGQRWRESRLAA